MPLKSVEVPPSGPRVANNSSMAVSQNSSKFGRYKVIRPLATGGMANLFLAHPEKSPNKQVLIKKVSQQLEHDPEFLVLFKRETQISLLLRHPNVLRTIEAGANGNNLYLVTEFIKGRNLRELMDSKTSQNETLSTHQISYIFREIAKGLHYLHRHALKHLGPNAAIIHRDISPHNIMVGHNGEVKIIDLGISKVQSSCNITVAGALKGKFSYMSPEQISEAPLTSATDIFSLGMLLFEVLSGKRFFAKRKQVEIIRDLAAWTDKSIEPALEKVPELFRPILVSMLARKPEDRPTAGQLTDLFSEIFKNSHDEDSLQNTAEVTFNEPPEAYEITVAKPADPTGFSEIITLYDVLTEDLHPPQRKTLWTTINAISLCLICAGIYAYSTGKFHQLLQTPDQQVATTASSSPSPSKTDKVLIKFNQPGFTFKKVRINGRLLSADQLAQGVVVTEQQPSFEYLDPRLNQWKVARVDFNSLTPQIHLER